MSSRRGEAHARSLLSERGPPAFTADSCERASRDAGHRSLSFSRPSLSESERSARPSFHLGKSSLCSIALAASSRSKVLQMVAKAHQALTGLAATADVGIRRDKEASALSARSVAPQEAVEGITYRMTPSCVHPCLP